MPQLFNVTEDPLEMHNLAQAMPDVAAAMDAALIAELGQSYEVLDATVKQNDQFIFVGWGWGGEGSGGGGVILRGGPLSRSSCFTVACM